MKKILLIVFGFSLLSCKSNDNSRNLSAIVLVDTLMVDFLDLPLPNERSSYGSSFDRFSYSYIFNDSIGIFILDLKSNLWNSFSIPLDGNSGLKKGGDFYFINDTLGLYNLKGSGEFQLLDFKSKTTLNYSFEDFRFNIGNASPEGVYYDKNIIGFPVSYSRCTKEMDYTKEVPIYAFFDLKENRLINSFGFPSDFHNEIYTLNDLSRTFSIVGQKIYLNMTKSPKIYVFDINGQLIDEEVISSNKVIDGNSDFIDDQMKSLIQYTYGGYYSSLLYDGKYFYRTASFLANKENFIGEKPSGFLNDLQSMKIEVIKFDKDFNLISKGEFFGSPSKKGIGDGNYFVANGKPYYWLLDKKLESQERFVSLE
jgi:hypothetical protein